MDDEDLTWIPRGVRTKLDLAGVRIHLADWQTLSLDERRELVAFDCTTHGQAAAFRARLAALIPTLEI
jgi:hypothetical protein